MPLTSTVPGYLALADAPGLVRPPAPGIRTTASELEAALRDAADLSGRWQKVQIGHDLSVDWRRREGATG
jgi:hypothetical protein